MNTTARKNANYVRPTEMTDEALRTALRSEAMRMARTVNVLPAGHPEVRKAHRRVATLTAEAHRRFGSY